MATINISIMTIKKGVDNPIMLTIGFMKLVKGEIDALYVNEYVFTLDAFKFKSGKVNHSKAVNALAWAYHSDIMHELCSL